jgi:hypothetical protein
MTDIYRLKREQIKELTTDLNNKKELIELLSIRYQRNPLSIKNHWLSGYYQVPEKLQDELIAIIKDWRYKNQSSNNSLTTTSI